MMEKILPRKLKNADDLRAFNPYLLDEDEDYDESDFAGINDVSILSNHNFFTGILRPRLRPFGRWRQKMETSAGYDVR
jgi:hypothetical protein